MATIVWAEDQRHWVDKFSDCLLATAFDDSPNQLIVLDGVQAVHAFCQETHTTPDLALLDARMHGDDQAGFTVSQSLRKRWPDLPIIYLSEHSGTQIEAQAFSLHSTLDFIAKHQRNVEQVLCWRIKALLRQRALNQPSAQSDCLQSGPLQIDLVSWDIYWAGTKLHNPKNPRRALPPTPRKILRYLVKHSPRPQTAAQVARALEIDEERFSNAAFRQHIRTLRDAIDGVCDGTFTELCKQGYGLVTAGEAGSYSWVKPRENDA